MTNHSSRLLRVLPVLTCFVAAPAHAEGPPVASPDALKSLGLRRADTVSFRVGHARPETGVPRIVLSAELPSADPAAPPRRLSLELDPFPLRSPDFRVVIVGDDLVQQEVLAPAPTAFHGTDPATGDGLWATIVGNHVRGILTPARPGAPLIYIQSLTDAGAPQDQALHAVYTAADILPMHGTCGLDQCPDCRGPFSITPTFVPRGPGTCKTAELIADCDFPFYQAKGLSIASVVQDVETVLLGANVLYRNSAGITPQIRFALKQVTIRVTSAADPFNALPLTDADASVMLVTQRTHWNAIASPPRDVVHLFTGRDLLGATIGLGYINALCGTFSHSLVQSLFTTNLAGRYADSAHELGHNLSFNHDPGPGFIMSPFIEAVAPTTFSAQSAAEYAAAIGGYTCLNNALADVLPDAVQVLPGQSAVIDVLANDGQGIVCSGAVTSFTLPSLTSALGGSVSVSVGTGPGGRNQVGYAPPAGLSGVEDSFTYTASGITARVYVTIVAPRQPDPFASVVAGLNARYFNLENPPGSVTLSPNFPNFAAVPQIGTGVGTQLNYPPTTGNAVGSNRNFALGAVFEGYLQVSTPGFYQFWLVSDDLSRLFVGNTVVVDNRAVNMTAEATGTIALAPGRHAIRVEYVNYANTSTLVLWYAVDANPRAPIPAARLWRRAGVCAADFNGNGTGVVGGVSVQDVFDYLTAWFGNNPRADFNGNGLVTVQDVFDYLTAFFDVCP